MISSQKILFTLPKLFAFSKILTSAPGQNSKSAVPIKSVSPENEECVNTVLKIHCYLLRTQLSKNHWKIKRPVW